jgi:hypothetical protein
VASAASIRAPSSSRSRRPGAYNRWLAEFVHPQRQVALAIVSHADTDQTVRTITWAAEAGCKGVLLDGLDPTYPNPAPALRARYEPI